MKFRQWYDLPWSQVHIREQGWNLGLLTPGTEPTMLSLEVVVIGTYLSLSSGSQLNSSWNPEQLLFDRRETGEGYSICNFFVHSNKTNTLGCSLCARHYAATAILVFLPVCHSVSPSTITWGRGNAGKPFCRGEYWGSETVSSLSKVTPSIAQLGFSSLSIGLQIPWGFHILTFHLQKRWDADVGCQWSFTRGRSQLLWELWFGPSSPRQICRWTEWGGSLSSCYLSLPVQGRLYPETGKFI